MAARLQGRVTNISDDDLGSSLDGDHAAGATTIVVQNAADFDEDGGTLVINDQQITYTSCDDDTDTIALAEGLAAAADDGDTVSVWDPLREVIAVDKMASVDVGDDYADDMEAVVALHLVNHLVEGPRGDDGESVVLELDEEDDEWKVVDILGLGSPAASGTRWEQDDSYVLTAADITAGVAVMPLSQRPNDEALKCVLAGVPQRPTEWTVDYDAQTLTMPLDGWERPGHVLWVHYAYSKGVTARDMIDFGSSGWRYLSTTEADSTDRSAASFNDSAWSVGAAPFADARSADHISQGYLPVGTTIAVNSGIWLRRTVHLQAKRAAQVSVRVDGSATVYWNGAQVGYISDTNVDWPARALVSFTIAAADVAGANVLAVNAKDDVIDSSADHFYVDVEVTQP